MRILFYFFSFYLIILFAFSTYVDNYSVLFAEKTKKEREETKKFPLLLVQSHLQGEKNIQHVKKVLSYLLLKIAKNKRPFKQKKFENFADIKQIISENKDSFSSIHIFLEPITWSSILKTYRNMSDIHEASENIFFYSPQKEFSINNLYAKILKYRRIYLFTNVHEILENGFFQIKKVFTHEYTYRQKNHIIIDMGLKKKYACFSTEKRPDLWINIRSSKKNSKIHLIRKFSLKILKKNFLANCFFRNKKGEVIAIEIMLREPEIKLKPKRIYLEYGLQKKIVEKEITITTEIPLHDVSLSIKAHELKAKPPVIFSRNQKWKWNPLKRRFRHTNIDGKIKKSRIQSSKKIHIAVIGERQNSLKGSLELWVQQKKIKEFELEFTSYFWGGIFWNWIRLYRTEVSIGGVILFALFLFLILFRHKKRRLAMLDSFPREFTYMIKKSQKIRLAKNSNPFGFFIPFIEKEHTIKIKRLMIEITSDERDEMTMIDLDETLGKAEHRLNENCVLSFSKEKFSGSLDKGEREGKSIIIMKLKSKHPEYQAGIVDEPKVGEK